GCLAPDRDAIGLAILGIVDLAGKSPLGAGPQAEDQLMAKKRPRPLGWIRVELVQQRLAFGIGRFHHPDDIAADPLRRRTTVLDAHASATVFRQKGAARIGRSRRLTAILRNHRQGEHSDTYDYSNENSHHSHLHCPSLSFIVLHCPSLSFAILG